MCWVPLLLQKYWLKIIIFHSRWDISMIWPYKIILLMSGPWILHREFLRSFIYRKFVHLLFIFVITFSFIHFLFYAFMLFWRCIGSYTRKGISSCLNLSDQFNYYIILFIYSEASQLMHFHLNLHLECIRSHHITSLHVMMWIYFLFYHIYNLFYVHFYLIIFATSLIIHCMRDGIWNWMQNERHLRFYRS